MDDARRVRGARAATGSRSPARTRLDAAAGRSRLSRAASDSPSSSSMTRNGSPSRLVPRSVTWAMPSWPICDAVIASRWNRAIIARRRELRVQDLDRDALAQRDVGADVDRAHATDREQTLDAVLVVEHRARRQGPRSLRCLHQGKG